MNAITQIVVWFFIFLAIYFVGLIVFGLVRSIKNKKQEKKEEKLKDIKKGE